MSTDHESTEANPDENENLLGNEQDTHTEEALQNIPNEGPSETAETPTLEDELATTKDQLLRALADAENTRKRAQREKEETAQYAIANFARDLLSVADNLNRALASLKTHDGDDIAPLIEGVEITEKELMTIFGKYKIEQIEALHQPFDHNVHQAMVEVPTDEHDAGIVIQEMQAGYKIGDRLLRPSMVGVSKTT